MFLINTFLGFLIMQIADILSRDKKSRLSPEKFSIAFFIKDSYQKILLSLVLSASISTVVYLNIEDSTTLFTEYSTYGKLMYVIIGAVPEIVVQRLKKKFGITQPSEVITKEEVFTRK